MRFYLRALAALALALLAGCASSPKADAKLLEQTLRSYASVIRWGEIEQAIAFIDPAVLEEHPIDRLELERFKQVQVAGYRERAAEMAGEYEAVQIVQLDLVNRHTQEVRSVVDRQRWRYDPVEKRWWLMSGLPRIAKS